MLTFARELLLALRREAFFVGSLGFNTAYAHAQRPQQAVARSSLGVRPHCARSLRMDRAPGFDQLAFISQNVARQMPVRGHRAAPQLRTSSTCSCRARSGTYPAGSTA